MVTIPAFKLLGLIAVVMCVALCNGTKASLNAYLALVSQLYPGPKRSDPRYIFPSSWVTKCRNSGRISFSIANRTALLEPGSEKIRVC